MKGGGPISWLAKSADLALLPFFPLELREKFSSSGNSCKHGTSQYGSFLTNRRTMFSDSIDTENVNFSLKQIFRIIRGSSKAARIKPADHFR